MLPGQSGLRPAAGLGAHQASEAGDSLLGCGGPGGGQAPPGTTREAHLPWSSAAATWAEQAQSPPGLAGSLPYAHRALAIRPGLAFTALGRPIDFPPGLQCEEKPPPPPHNGTYLATCLPHLGLRCSNGQPLATMFDLRFGGFQGYGHNDSNISRAKESAEKSVAQGARFKLWRDRKLRDCKGDVIHIILPSPPPTHDHTSLRSACRDAALISPRPVSLSLACLAPDHCVWGALRLVSPRPREEALVFGSASGPSQPASRSPHSQSPAWRRRHHTHTHTHTHAHTHPEEGSLILSHWRLGPERKIVWVNSQASRLNARLPPPPLRPLPPPPLPFHPTRHPHSAPQPGPERAPRARAGAEGSPGSKGRSPEGMPSSLCPEGQKRTAGRWDRPGPRPDVVMPTFEISCHERVYSALNFLPCLGVLLSLYHIIPSGPMG
ncbi:atrophin-1-like [Panthera uncia]|uniref:atrophin-1-like n=1 Tax=Panthera uncia TaxID=29064 RepID=UPI0020FFA703|nr:atrophin-1-like [Panthera uncia]